MSTFTVTVRTQQGDRINYCALGTDSAAVHMAAIDRFGVCRVTVMPQPRRPQ